MNAVLFDVALTAYILAAAAALASLVWRRDDLSRVARLLTQGGWVCHTAAIVLRGVELGRAPVLTLAEVVSVVIWLAVFLDLWVERRYGITTFGVCGGAWIAARLRCPFCESWNSRDLVRLVAEELDEGYFIEACRACQGYLKGVDRRQRWNAGAPLVEDWGSPHLDLYAAREGYWRSTPSLAHLLPPGEEERA